LGPIPKPQTPKPKPQNPKKKKYDNFINFKKNI